MNRRQALGSVILASVAMGLFAFVAAEKGVWGAAITFGLAIVLAAVIVLAINLLAE